ncbi:MAG: hypothetical protein A2170_16990 [Deltaproteobacteria bacterium RBG_13_53_10]|nr:MAG: hypothetical protein A2170_16990 [Deltaproteobacteria bacterium RBG_13_53_10]
MLRNGSSVYPLVKRANPHQASSHGLSGRSLIDRNLCPGYNANAFMGCRVLILMAEDLDGAFISERYPSFVL